MIRINLLPQELQKASRTPPKFFIAIIALVALSMSALCAYGYLSFNVIVLKERTERKKGEAEHFMAKAQEVDALLEDIADYKQREQVIISIKTNRIIWSKKLDELCRITPGFIWIVRLEMREFDPSEYKWPKDKPQSGGFVVLKCYSSGNDVDRMTAYRQRLKGAEEYFSQFMSSNLKPHNFYSDFIHITPPEWRAVVIPPFAEPNNIQFTVRLELRPLAEKPKKTA